MNLNYKNKSQLLSLKAKIKGLAQEGRRTRKFIKNSSKEKRYNYWEVKRSLGHEARYHLIAYGLLRGLAYSKIEPSSSKEGLIYFDFGYLAQIIQHHGFQCDAGKWTPANLERLIRTGFMSASARIAS